MASDPDDDHSFVLKSFSRIFSIVDKISTSACNAAAALAGETNNAFRALPRNVLEGTAGWGARDASAWPAALSLC